MISRLSGVVAGFEGDHVVVDVNGVGYEVRIPQRARDQLPPLGEPITLYIRTLFDENEGMLLFGFLEPAHRRLFDLLIRVTGVGPRLALNIMGATEPEQLARAIARQDARFLRTLPGVGAKLADRIVLELSDKVAEFAFERQIERLTSAKAIGADVDALVEGLVQLGYSRREASSALQTALAENPQADEQTLLRLALKRLRPMG